jgi:acyl carrier protein
MENKIREIMAQVFNVPEVSIDSLSSPDTIESWDSLRHMNLVTALEEEFSVRFTYEQISEMLNFSLIIEVLKENDIK